MSLSSSESEEIDLGVTTPTMEDCVQLGRDDYYARARFEGRCLFEQLRRMFGEPPDGVSFSIKGHEHDFGRYLTCVVRFDPTNPECERYARTCEESMPGHWDDVALAAIASFGAASPPAAAHPNHPL